MNTKKYKYEAVTDKLREMILNGKFPGDRLPREEDIVKTFNVSRITILKAMKLLAKEGLLTRVKGTGTFINRGNSTSAGEIMHRTVVVAMPTNGHYYNRVYRSITDSIQDQNLYPVSYNIRAVDFGNLTKKANLNTLLNSPVKGIILDGGGFWRNPDLLKCSSLHSVFVDFYDWKGKPPQAAVLIDYEHGAYMATKHLLESGRKNIILITHKNTISIDLSDSHKANHPRWMFNAGCQRAIDEFPGASFRWVNCTLSEDNFDLLASGIISQKPDGIICRYDYIAAKLCSVALQLGVKVPEDIAITGCYNTPWVFESEVPLTSIEVKPEEMGKLAVKSLIDKNDEIIYLKPELKVRASSDLSKDKNQVIDNDYVKNNIFEPV